MTDIKVLVVDDDELLREMLKGWLHLAGFSVVSAANGEDGLLILEAHRPDVVVTDLTMPVMDGIQFCREARKISDVPILVFSGLPDKECRESAMTAGADGYVVKNIGMSAFISTVEGLAKRRKQVA
ncbi:MAG: response regulator [SAR202 cluster bacterium]|nr:response regulator [SAR202 cluster bacterium]